MVDSVGAPTGMMPVLIKNIIEGQYAKYITNEIWRDI